MRLIGGIHLVSPPAFLQPSSNVLIEFAGSMLKDVKSKRINFAPHRRLTYRAQQLYLIHSQMQTPRIFHPIFGIMR
jgi:hypothetical protein